MTKKTEGAPEPPSLAPMSILYMYHEGFRHFSIGQRTQLPSWGHYTKEILLTPPSPILPMYDYYSK